MHRQPTMQRQTSDMIRVVGFDPSMSNWGIARGILVPGDAHSDAVIEIHDLSVIKTQAEKAKQIRRNSDDLDRAESLMKGAMAAAEGAQAIFVEVPVNSQSARAAVAYGLCVGILGALRAMGIPFFEVNPTEVKLAATGDKNASKIDMINWATGLYPQAPWPTQTVKGATSIVASTAEHMADAVAAIHAGIASKSFKQMLPFIQR